MYLKTGNKKECFGCFACQDVCPTSAITTSKDNDGYYYPIVDKNKCINCNKCEAVCPDDSKNEYFRCPTSAFAGIHKSETDFQKSASGGAFKAIVEAILLKHKSDFKSFYCVGCKFDEHFNVIHDIVEITNIDDVDVFSKSKYVQSYPLTVYKRAKEILKNKSNFVIFSGTPCQSLAFRKYIGETHENYFVIDLICHGAPSQMFFDDYLKQLENTYNSKLTEFEFKTKKVLENGTRYTRSVRYKFENGIERRLSRLEDSYLHFFYNELYPIRPSCSECKFKRSDRVGDITIGDAWNINKLHPDIVPTQGVSSLIFNSAKSIELIDDIKLIMNTYEMNYEFMVQNNEPLQNK